MKIDEITVGVKNECPPDKPYFLPHQTFSSSELRDEDGRP
jgi:hypothetical protein